MSKARDRYYEFKKESESHFEGLQPEITDYISELEAEKSELLEFIKNIEDTNLDELLDIKIPDILNKYSNKV